MYWTASYIFLGFMLMCTSAAAPPQHTCTDYAVGQNFSIQCKNAAGEWDHGPMCHETQGELSFIFGKDSFVWCGLLIRDEDMLNLLRSIVARDREWSCRAVMAPDHPDIFIPISIPVWGIIEPTHMHISQHLNFVFHADKGKLLAAAIYPVKDVFQVARVGSVMSFHGPVKWFNKHSFRDYSPSLFSAVSGDASTYLWILTTFLITFVASAILFGSLYHYYLRPQLLRKGLKHD